MGKRNQFCLAVLLAVALHAHVFAVEERKGTIQRVTDPVCNLGCGSFYLDPDPLYSFTYLRGYDFYPWLGKHVQVIGTPGTCGGCKVLDVISITELPPTDVVEENIPRELALKQNYPNPFNPETEIGYDVPSVQHVSLAIYNMLGQKIAEPVNRVEQVGRYSVKWNAEKYASGVYYYMLATASGTLVKRMILIR